MDLWFCGYTCGMVGFITGMLVSRIRYSRRPDTEVMRSRDWRELREKYGAN